MDLANYRFTKSHEWALIEDDVCTVGITEYAVEQLTDITNLDIKPVGTQVTAEQPFGEIESVKAVFDLNSPVTGEIIEINASTQTDYTQINDDPYSKGWMIKIRLAPDSPRDHLKTKEQYQQQLASEEY